jgi:glycosyltransferase involved in cell wall biosynthesis
MKAKISVVVPTYNRRPLLEKCLDALLDQSISQDKYEVIVIDDSSSDDTQKHMEERTQQTINLIYMRHSVNQGRVSTRNDGIRAAQGDIVIFLDNDNVPSRNFVEAHQRYHEKYSGEHIAVVGNVRFATELIAGSNFGRYMQSRYLGYRKHKELKKLDLSNLPPQYFGGLNSSVRKEDLFAVGLFDTRFRYYGGEDETMGYCLKKIGVRIVFNKEAESLHYDIVSISRYKTKYEEVGREGMPKMIADYPEYLRTLRAKWLWPINYSQDKLSLILGKMIYRGLLNLAVLNSFQKWAVTTDRYSWAYCPIVYRLLLGGWLLQGLKSKEHEVGMVTYT